MARWSGVTLATTPMLLAQRRRRYAFRTIDAKQSRTTRWSATAFVLVAALLFSVIAFRHITSALILVAVVLAIVIAVHAALRVARRRG